MSQASYPDGWHDYKAFCSSDRTTWHRVQTTSYVGGKLVIDLRPVPSDCVYLAYFVPYNYGRHLDFVASTVAASRGGGGGGGPAVTLHTLGSTLDGRPLDCLRFGSPGAWTPEAQFAGASPEDAAAFEQTQLALSPWERQGVSVECRVAMCIPLLRRTELVSRPCHASPRRAIPRHAMPPLSA